MSRLRHNMLAGILWNLNIANFENSDLDKFQKQLEQLTWIFNHLIASTSYLRNTSRRKLLECYSRIIGSNEASLRNLKRAQMVGTCFLFGKLCVLPKLSWWSIFRNGWTDRPENLKNRYKKSWPQVEQNTRDLMQFSFESNQKANGAALLLALKQSLDRERGIF